MNSKTYFSPLLLIVVLAAEAQVSKLESAVRLLVKWKDGPDSPAAPANNAQIGSTLKRSFNALGWQLIELPPGVSATDGIAVYRSLQRVAAVEADGPMKFDP